MSEVAGGDPEQGSHSLESKPKWPEEDNQQLVSQIPPGSIKSTLDEAGSSDTQNTQSLNLIFLIWLNWTKSPLDPKVSSSCKTNNLSNILSLKKHLLFQIFHQYQSQFSTWRNSVLTSVFTTHQMHTLGFAHPLLWTSVSQAQKKQYNPTVSPANLEMWEQCAEKGVRSSSKVPWFSFILFF